MLIFNKEEIPKESNIISLFFIEIQVLVFFIKIDIFALHVSLTGLNN